MVSFLKKGILVSLFMLCVFFAGPAFGAVTGITIDLQNLGLEIGQTGTLVATVIAEDADDKTFTWASDHPEIATINQNGQVTAFKTGGAVITATTNTGGFVASSYVSVSAPTIPVRGISLDKTALILGIGETYTLIPSFSPTDATGKHVLWTSSDDSVAAVDITGKVSAVSLGSARITATTVDGGYSAYCDVDVINAIVPVTGVSLDRTALSLGVGQTSNLVATVTPSDATGKHVTWTTGDGSIATVDFTGKVSAVSPGTTRITATTVDGGFSAYCDVEVINAIVAVTGISLDKTALTLGVGEISQLISTVMPDNATGKHVTWTSSNNSVATVDFTGQVVAITPGTARITATTVDGGFSAYCDIEVINAFVPVTGISLDRTAITVDVGQTSQLIATVSPANATGKHVTWTSSSNAIADVDITGQVSAVAPGIARITATTVDGGFTQYCDVEVKSPLVPVTGVSLDKTALLLITGQTSKLNATVTPSSATGKHVTWTSSNNSIAGVDITGNVTAVSPGNARITVTTVDGGFTAYCDVEVKTSVISVTGVSLDRTALSLGVGQTSNLVATVTPSNADDKHVTWQSSNNSIAEVDITGQVSAIAQGIARISVTTVDGGFTAYCDVEVKTPVVPVTGVSLDKTALSLTVGETSQLIATVTPSNASGKHVTWESSNASVAEVDITGQVSAVSPGSARITVTTVDGGLTAYCEVSVRTSVVPVTGISLDKTALFLSIGETSQLNATVIPSNATGKHITWSSSNDSVAAVNLIGQVSALSTGFARITVTTVDGGFSAYCDVEVKTAVVPVTGVSLDKTALSLNVGETSQLITTITPANATGKHVTWSSSNNSVAAVNITGQVRALSPGTARITVTTVDGGFTAYCEVEVNTAVVPVTGVTLDKTVLSLSVGQSSQLVATVTPPDATGKHVTWESSNNSIAAVDITGQVTGMSPGNARITVTTVDGGFSAYCDVVVRSGSAPVTGVTFDHPSLSILVGNKKTLGAIVWPADAANKAVTWTSSNVSVASIKKVFSSVTADSSAEIFGESPGTATITATTLDGGYTAQCEVEVVRDTGGAVEGGCNTGASPYGISGLLLLVSPFLLLLKKNK
ncbi:hypothetical protein SDC9_53896 [bioreactor metagenome]|jgi:uncharacterized protein YjdB|uniref:BIG2 domain-containing protein n=1 Tax=bioreactor metagenome TaxID=1076179 RepID=A0A644WUM9_9ZZZZ